MMMPSGPRRFAPAPPAYPPQANGASNGSYYDPAPPPPPMPAMTYQDYLDRAPPPVDYRYGQAYPYQSYPPR
jgi:hypothetical protein